MKAITVPTPGGPDALKLTELPSPELKDGEVLINVVAAGVNRADVGQRQGTYPSPPGSPDYPGLEVSGRIAQDGSGFLAGDEVVALLSGGGYAEQVAVPAGQVLAAPKGVSLIEAAAFPETAATVYSNVVMAAGLQAGQTFLVHGGSSGIGAMAIQLAKALGCTVITTAGSDEKCQHARDLGADVAINYREEDFVEVTNRHGGADVILDVVGAGYLMRNVQALATGGKLVIIAVQSGSKTEFDIMALLQKRASVIGTTLRSRPTQEKASIMHEVQRVIWPLIAEGKIKPVVDQVFPLSEASQAHEYFDSGKHQGKILLTMGD